MKKLLLAALFTISNLPSFICEEEEIEIDMEVSKPFSFDIKSAIAGSGSTILLAGVLYGGWKVYGHFTSEEGEIKKTNSLTLDSESEIAEPEQHNDDNI